MKSVHKTVQPDSLVAFARTLIGIPYLYASTDPAKDLIARGLLLMYLIILILLVPRSSVDFTNYGR